MQGPLGHPVWKPIVHCLDEVPLYDHSYFAGTELLEDALQSRFNSCNLKGAVSKLLRCAYQDFLVLPTRLNDRTRAAIAVPSGNCYRDSHISAACL